MKAFQMILFNDISRCNTEINDCQITSFSVICVVWQAAFSYLSGLAGCKFSYLCGLAGCIQLFVWFGRLHSVICVVWQAVFSYLCGLAGCIQHEVYFLVSLTSGRYWLQSPFFLSSSFHPEIDPKPSSLAVVTSLRHNCIQSPGQPYPWFYSQKALSYANVMVMPCWLLSNMSVGQHRGLKRNRQSYSRRIWRLSTDWWTHWLFWRLPTDS